jgi:mannose-1-phosphate guanylyltransferase
MRAMLLAAGFGTRLKPMTDTVPKCLVPIHGRPLLEYWLQMLRNAGVQPILINTHYFADAVLRFLDSLENSSNIYTVYEDNLLGTAGTLLKNREFFGNSQIMLIHADNLSRFNVSAFIQAHQQRPASCEITMMTFVSQTPQSCGIVELDDFGVVKAFHEKATNPPGNLANGAVYIIEPSILTFLDNLGKVQIDFSTEVLPRYLGKINTFHNDVYHRDIGTMESYKAALVEFPAAWFKE